MRLIGLLFATLSLGGCGFGPEPGHGPRHGGRYLGIGIYSPGAMWQRLAGVERAQDDAAATLRDDEQIIVVVDSQTGEVRQCGNLSGHCIRMNPWSAQQPAPVRLSEHAADIDGTGSVSNEAAPTANAH
ncbi:MAG TPA: hypothetical protein VGW40_10825 [Allosphingosinicella sp.]|nr:hypothetical protein [Allosphingosinicella sp.]